MKRVSKKTLRHLFGICSFLMAFLMMSTVAKAADTELNVGAAAVLDSDETDKDEKSDVVITVGAVVGETISLETEEAEEAKQVEAETEAEEESESAAASLVIAKVDNSVNVREAASEDAAVEGKLFKNCSGIIIEQGEGWTKIQSGNLTGWVSNDYLYFGEEAEAMIAEVGSLKATIQTDALRVRKEASEDAGVYKLVKKGDVMDAVEELGDWVSVQVDKDTIGYVSAEYVSVEFTTDHGKTLKEIEDEEREKELAKLSKNRGAVPTSVSDVTLLAALIQAEAGNQPYEGKLAVGAVVMNRVRSGGYPNSIIGVITAPGQFPPATNGTVAAIASRGPSASCMQAAQAAVDGQTNVGGALHFGRVGKAAGVVIGSHVFY